MDTKGKARIVPVHNTKVLQSLTLHVNKHSGRNVLANQRQYQTRNSHSNSKLGEQGVPITTIHTNNIRMQESQGMLYKGRGAR